METTKEPKGPILGIIVIIILLVVGGIYIFMNQRNSGLEVGDNPKPELIDLGPESTSINLDTVQSELESTDLGSLDAELNSIESELNAQ